MLFHEKIIRPHSSMRVSFDVEEVRTILLPCIFASLALLFSVAVVRTGAATSKFEEITGVVIAHDYIKSSTPCYQGRCEGSLIVQIETPTEKERRYIRVDFGYSERHSPRMLVQNKRRWRFKLIRTSNLDEPVSEFIQYERTGHRQEKKLPIWRLVPGAEDEKLPFGETLPSYALVKNGFTTVDKD